MDVKDLKRLLESVKASDIGELVLETGDFKLTVKRGGVAPTYEPGGARSAPQSPEASPPSLIPTADPVPVAPTEAAPAEVPTPAPTQNTAASSEITAPIVGTFYAAPSPDAPDFVKVGDRVEAGTVLCIIEAMKLMNEIEAEVAGTVREILVRDTEPVEYGQPLFRLEPA